MARNKILIVVIIVVVLGALGFVFKDQILNLASKSPPENNTNRNQLQVTKIETKRVDIASLALPQNFPADIPLFPGAKITESYNLIETKTNAVKVAAIKLSSSQSMDKIKDFYSSKLKSPNYNFATNSNKGDTGTKKTIVFNDKTGILIINLSKEAENTVVEITEDILFPSIPK